jgi:mRNA-degrading endonuclease YafQ of YafQ-DinJ toxin-antitoxin module
MREPIYHGKFKRDLRKAEQRGYDVHKMREAIRLLATDAVLPDYL